jgi:hypothetical protein
MDSRSTAVTDRIRFITTSMGAETVMFHGGSRTFTRKTLRSMIEQACWDEEDLRRLKLIR